MCISLKYTGNNLFKKYTCTPQVHVDTREGFPGQWMEGLPHNNSPIDSMALVCKGSSWKKGEREGDNEAERGGRREKEKGGREVPPPSLKVQLELPHTLSLLS